MLTTTATATATNPQRRHNSNNNAQKQQRVQQLNRQLLLFGVTFLIGVILYAPIGQAMPLTDSAEQTIETKRYCSSNLSDAIRQICGGRYNSLGRKFPDSVGHGAIRSLQSLAPAEDYFRPLTNGPIHECCRRPCGYNELKTYCAPID